MRPPLLEIRECSMHFGGLVAVSHLTFSVKKKELIGIIGPNGAGKTTLFNMVSGLYTASTGSIWFNGEDVTYLAPWHRSRKGISRTFQNIRLFPNLSVFDTIRVGAVQHCGHHFFSSILQLPSFHQEEERIANHIHELLRFFSLYEYKDRQATTLPYGDQRKIEMIRALVTQPKLLLLDEPAAGLNPTEKKGLMQLIKRIQEQFHIAMILIEHDMPVIMGICERVIVLDYGVKIAEGSPSEIQSNSKVIEAYLGTIRHAKN